MSNRSKIGLIGLGAMGLPMGKRLLARGHKLVVAPHRNQAPAQELAALGADMASSPGDVRRECWLVISIVPDVPQVRDVLFGEGGLALERDEALVHVDMSTINPTAAREFHSRLGSLGMETLDAPVSGGPMRAADGSLTIMAGGSEATFAKVLPVLQDLGKFVVRVGDAGSGQAVKLVNQLMISIIMVANAEALTLGVKAGVPLEVLTQVIGTASGSNYLMQNWLPRTLFSGDLEQGFALDLLMKDLNAALQWAGEVGLPAFGGSLAQQLYRLAKLDGGGSLDYSVVARLYEQAAGIELRLPE